MRSFARPTIAAALLCAGTGVGAGGCGFGGAGGAGSSSAASSGAPGTAGSGAASAAGVVAASGATASAAPLPAPPSGPDLEVAMVWSSGGASRLWLCATGSGKCRPASAEERDAPTGSAALAWSPDGRVVVFGTADILRFVDADVGTLVTVVPGRRAAYSPDGKLVAVVEKAGVALLNATLSSRRLVAASVADAAHPSDDVRYDAVLGWSRDGTRLAVLVSFYEGSGLEVLSVPDGRVVSESAHWAAAWTGLARDRFWLAAFDKVASYAEDGLWLLDLAVTGKKAGPKRLGEAGDGLLAAPGDTLLIGYAEAGTFTRTPEEWRPRGVLAVRLVPKKRGGPELHYRRVVAGERRCVPIGLGEDGRVLLYGVGGAADLFESYRWADLASGETGEVPVPAGGGRALAAALRPSPSRAAHRTTAAIDAAWARGTPAEVRDRELVLVDAPPPESAAIVKPLPIPWPASWPASMPAGAYGTGSPAGGAPLSGSHAPRSSAP